MDSTQDTDPPKAVITDQQFTNCLKGLFGALSYDEDSY